MAAGGVLLLATLLAASTVQPVAASDHHDAVELIKEFMKKSEEGMYDQIKDVSLASGCLKLKVMSFTEQG